MQTILGFALTFQFLIPIEFRKVRLLFFSHLLFALVIFEDILKVNPRFGTDHSSLWNPRFGTDHSSLWNPRFGTDHSSLWNPRFGTDHSSLWSPRFGTDHSSLWNRSNSKRLFTSKVIIISAPTLLLTFLPTLFVDWIYLKVPFFFFQALILVLPDTFSASTLALN
jgi:hypothetical protein